MAGLVPATQPHIADSSPWMAGTEPATTTGTFRACGRLHADARILCLRLLTRARTTVAAVVGNGGGSLPPVFCKRIPAQRSGTRFSPNKTNNSVTRLSAGVRLSCYAAGESSAGGGARISRKRVDVVRLQSAHPMLERRRNWRGTPPNFPRFEWELSVSWRGVRFLENNSALYGRGGADAHKS
jgi:hypothetical protein